MTRSDNLFLALHVLLHMLRHPGRPVTSQTMAGWGGTHPVVIRRTFAGLRKAGIVVAEKGHGGGWRLARDAQAITVADIQRALASKAPVQPSQRSQCLIEMAIGNALTAARSEADRLLEQRFESWTLADFDVDVSRLQAASSSIIGDLS